MKNTGIIMNKNKNLFKYKITIMQKLSAKYKCCYDKVWIKSVLIP